jgi:hypothetical protein
MLSLVLATTLAAAPAPRAATSADTLVHIPRLDALAGLSTFLERAGRDAALLRPAAWYAELHPFLPLDPQRPETLTAAGIDPAGPLTLSLDSTGRVSCVRLTDAKAFQARAAAALGAEGREVKPSTASGVTTVSVPRDMGGHAGYALKGNEACAFSSLSSGFVEEGWGKALLKESSRLVGRAPKPDARLSAVPGLLYIVAPGRKLVLGVGASATELRLEGSSAGLPLPAFQAAGTSPYGAMKPEGLLFSRARVAPASLGHAVGNVSSRIQQVCPDCPPAEVDALARTVARHLTGHTLLRVEEVKVRGSLRTPEARFFAPRQALAAELTDAAAVKAALAPLAKFPGARALEDGHALTVKGGTLFVRLSGRHLVVGNDEAATQTLLAALPSQGARLERAVDFTLDPQRVSRGLAQVSLMDVVKDKQLAGIFAIAVELGPLLGKSEHLTGWLDSAPGNTHRFSLTWTLPPAAP